MKKSQPSTPFNLRKPRKRKERIDQEYSLTASRSYDESWSSVSYLSDANCSPDSKDYARLLKNSLGIKKRRVLSYGSGPGRTHHEPKLNSLLGVDRIARRQVSKKVQKHCFRHIPNMPFKVLDAPDLTQDFYRQHIDWSGDNVLAVALGSSVYLWDAVEKSIKELVSFDELDLVSSVSFSEVRTDVVSVATENGDIGIYDCGKEKRIRALSSHNSYVNVTAWNESIVATGSKDGTIILHDIRIANDTVKTLNYHSSDVCNLKWDLTGQKLASGGNDHGVNVYNMQASKVQNTFVGHQAAVKGLAWCPQRPSVLATGGGRKDKTLKLWNVNSGDMIDDIKLSGSVSSIHFSTFSKEIVASVGKTVQLLTHPNLRVGKTLSNHESDILGMSLSPCGSSVVSCSGDETLCFWKVFDEAAKTVTSGLQENIGRQNVLR